MKSSYHKEKKSCIFFTIPADQKSKIKEKWKAGKISRSYKGKKIWNINLIAVLMIVEVFEKILKILAQQIGRTGDPRKNWDHPDNIIMENS